MAEYNAATQAYARLTKELAFLASNSSLSVFTARLNKTEVARHELHTVQASKPDPLPAAFAVANLDKAAPATFFLQIGDPKHKLGQVEPGIPLVLDPLAPGARTTAPEEAAGRRTILANWLASAENPLTARVMVNRIWQFRMGTGLVRMPNDFGLLGDRPGYHKTLLDWLAVAFVEGNWSVKAIDRLIVMSSAYQHNQFLADAAPGNNPERIIASNSHGSRHDFAGRENQVNDDR